MKKNIILIFFLLLSVLKVYATPNDLYQSAWVVLRDNYYDQSMNNQDWSTWEKKYNNLEKYEDAYAAINTMVESLNEPYTRFLRPEFYKDEVLDMEGKTFDYGIRLIKTKKGFFINPLKGSIAEKNGINKNDILLELDNRPIGDHTLEEINLKLLPSEIKSLKLLINKGGREQLIELIPKEEKIQSVFDSPIYKRKIPKNIKYIRISSLMDKNVAQDFKNTIEDSPKAEAYIIDLRNNLGGFAKNGAVMANMLLTNCIITMVEDRNGQREVIRANQHLLTSKPIVVLSNNNSASASEIFIAAIKENERGIIIGEKSYGKAFIQDVFNLPHDCGLNITVRRYLTPNGNDIHNKGIEPNLYIKLSKLDKIFNNDIVLKKAISIIQKM